MSTREELEEFEYQLETTEQTLKDDPNNADLLSLKEELSTLIALTKEYLGQQSASSSSRAGPSKAGPSSSSLQPQPGQSSKPAATFTAGTDVLAKWHVDNKMYPARIVSVSGSASDPVYTVLFKVDNSTEVVRSGDVKALSESRKRAFDKVDSLQIEKDSADSGSERDGKKVKKVEKKQAKEEDRKARVAEQNAKQSSWQSFAKKGAKKGYHIPGVSGESQFRTPDNPHGRVGVVGSGKGMTAYEQKKRAVWEAKE